MPGNSVLLKLYARRVYQVVKEISRKDPLLFPLDGPTTPVPLSGAPPVGKALFTHIPSTSTTGDGSDTRASCKVCTRSVWGWSIRRHASRERISPREHRLTSTAGFLSRNRVLSWPMGCRQTYRCGNEKTSAHAVLDPGNIFAGEEFTSLFSQHPIDHQDQRFNNDRTGS